MYSFSCDYLEGAHPQILELMYNTNLQQGEGYSLDPWCREAEEQILRECAAPDSKVFFISGGTQCNATLISAALRPHQGVLCADNGHINVHEAGAVEATGHKVMALPGNHGKLTAEQIRQAHKEHWAESAHDQTVQPGLVYLSHPTEYGTLYNLEELKAISETCRELGLYLYVDGARLAYALAAPGNDITMADLAALTDAFYIGGTKCGALLGEAMVIQHPSLQQDFRYIMRRHCALLAKGRLMGQQFAALMKDSLYLSLGEKADVQAAAIGETCRQAGIELFLPVESNQIFVLMSNTQMEELARDFIFTHWGTCPDGREMLRFVTSWATTDEAVAGLQNKLKEVAALA